MILYMTPMNLRWPEAIEPAAFAGNEAHIWAVPLNVRASRWKELSETLAPDERERANIFHFDDPRRRFVIARGALRRLLGRYLCVPPASIEFVLDHNGKPRLAPQHGSTNLNFNVSHSGDLALIAVAAGCEVGIDVECLREVGHLEQIARRFFHPAETNAVLATPAAVRNHAFLRCWTGKEAVLKAFGTGLTASLADFQVPISESWQGWIEWTAEPRHEQGSRCWLQQLTPCDGYVAAIACVESQCCVQCFTLAI